MVVEIQDEVIEFPRQPTDLDHPVEALSTGAQRNLQQAVHQRPAAGPAVHLRSTPLQSFPQQSGASNIQFTTTQEGAETGGTGAQRHVSHQVNNYVAGGTSTIHYGDIFINPNRTIFDFADKNESKDQKFLIAKKSKHQTKRLSAEIFDGGKGAKAYVPYEDIISTDESSKRSLFKITTHFDFLDRSFAEYFRVVAPTFDEDYIRQQLRLVREQIGNRHGNKETPVYLGDLGEYCELVSLVLPRACTRAELPFTITHTGDSVIHNLQDELDIPYWRFLLRLFLERSKNTMGGKTLDAEIVMRVLDSVMTDLQDDIHHLKAKGIDKIPTVIWESIEKRVKVLRTTLDSTFPGHDVKADFLSSAYDKAEAGLSDSSSKGSMPSKMSDRDGQGTSRNETAILISLIFLGLSAAMIPGYKGFSLTSPSSPSTSPGEASSPFDADFYFLLQSSIMTVLGKVIAIIPLLRKSWLSSTYMLMWCAFGLSFVLAVVSVVLYIFVRSGWSSVASFLSSVASVAAVLVLTQATGKETRKQKRE